jgi:NAD(P)-dependent dehydrogenase (short-subunit alcohol dehydrogenase family)
MIVVVTGSSSGLGAALASEFINRGATVIGASRRQVALPIHNYNADVSVENQCIQLILDVISEYGRIDVLINNAGRGNYASIEDTTTQMWHEIFAVNVDSMFWLTREVLPHMRHRNSGHIVNIASTAGTIGFPYNAAYVAAKHAAVGFTAALRTELMGTDINATVVCPAGVITDWGNVTLGGSINTLYAKAIPRSRVIAREQGLMLAPLFKLITADSAAKIIVDAINSGRCNDIFTHEGSRDLAVQASINRIELEDRHRALFLAMQEAYRADHE